MESFRLSYSTVGLMPFLFKFCNLPKLLSIPSHLEGSVNLDLLIGALFEWAYGLTELSLERLVP